MYKCPYCGNKSGKMDRRGNCISCGGVLEVVEVKSSPDILYSGVSGSFWYIDMNSLYYDGGQDSDIHTKVRGENA